MKLKIIICELMLVLSICAQVQPGRAADTPSVKSNTAVKTCDPTLATEPAAAIFGHKEKKIILIDVRPQAQFDQYHIAGSLNMSLNAIKTKAFLKSKPIVLVNEGFVLRPLAQTCQTLNASGFKATILAGGLMAWKHKGGELIGDPFALNRMNRITPRLLEQEKSYAHLLIIEASRPADSGTGTLGSEVRHLPLLDNQQETKVLKRIIDTEGSTAFARLVIFTPTGKENDRIQRQLAQSGIDNAFFLEGGLQAYEKHLQYIQLAKRPAADRKVTTGGCKSCARSN